MEMSDDLAAKIQDIQHTANDTMTRVILFEMETVGDVERETTLIIEPLSLEIVTDAD